METIWKVRSIVIACNIRNDGTYIKIVINSLFESIQTLFWTGFGEIGLESFDLKDINPYTRFCGLLMFGAYLVLNVTVLLNLLIAMMSNSYSLIQASDMNFKTLCPCNF